MLLNNVISAIGNVQEGISVHRTPYRIELPNGKRMIVLFTFRNFIFVLIKFIASGVVCSLFLFGHQISHS